MCELGAGVQATTHRRPYISTMDAYVLSLLNIAKGVNLLGYYVFTVEEILTLRLCKKRHGVLKNCLPILNYDFQAPLANMVYLKKNSTICVVITGIAPILTASLLHHSLAPPI